MPARPITLTPESATAPLNVIGVSITVLAAREDTGSHEVTLQEGPEGAGPPPHSHPWDESFYVLRGSVGFMLGGERRMAAGGSFVHVPAHTVHAFQFGPEGGAMLEVAGAGGEATAMFKHLDREVPPGPPDIPRVVEILATHRCAVAL